MRRKLFSIALLSALLIAAGGEAADFTVNPVRVFFESAQRTGALSIKNNSEQKLALQLSVLLWRQDEAGQDVYQPTEELIVFPKILNIEGGGEQIIRVGLRTAAGAAEKTYRIYLDEIPQPRSQEEGASLRTLLRVGVPVFIAPEKPEVAGAVVDMGLKGGVLGFTVANSGNTHFVVRAVKVEGADASGASVFQAELAGRYLHGGRQVSYSVEIPRENCMKIKTLKVDVGTSKVPFYGLLDVTREMCSR